MKYKSVLAAFVFITFACFIGLLFFIQTKSFGTLLTKVVSDLSEKKVHAHVSLKNVELSFFPPGLELNKVSIEKTSGDERIKAEFGKLGFYINLIEIEERRLSFGEIRISDSTVEYDHPESSEETKEIKQEVIDKIFDYSSKSPVTFDTLVIENSHIHVNHDILEARRLKIFKKAKNFIVRFHLANIRPVKESDKGIDELWGDVEISRKNLDIYRLKILHDVQAVLVKGRVENYRLLKGSTAQFNGEAHLHMKNLDQEVGITKSIQFHDGFANAAFSGNYRDGKLTGGSKVAIHTFKSNLLDADSLVGELKFHNQGVELIKATLKHGEEQATLLAPVLAYDIPRRHIIPVPLNLELNKVTFTNALQIVPELNTLHGKMTGRITIRHDRGDFYFKPQDGFHLNNVALIVGKKQTKIVNITSAKLTDADLAVVDGEVRISAVAKLPRSHIEVDGFVNKNKIRFSILDAPFNLEDLGNIADLDIKGSGPLSLQVTGGGKDVELNLKGKMKNLEIIGYKLGTGDTNITIDLGDDNVIIHKLDSVYGSTPISLTGAVNYGNLDIALGVNSEATNYYDLSQILHPIFTKMDFLPKDINFNAKVDADVYGKMNLKDLKVKSEIKFTDLTGYGENINSGSMNIGMNNEVVSLTNIEALKGKGHIFGNFAFVMPTDHLSTSLNWENLEVSSFNLPKILHMNIEGKINGKMKGGGKADNYELALSSQMYDSRSEGYRFDDSTLEMKIYPERVKGDLNFLGTRIKSIFDLSMNLVGRSELDLKVNLPEIKPIMVAMLGEHVVGEDITGRMFAELKTEFNGQFKNMNLTAHLKELSFAHPDFRFNHNADVPQFIIKDNNIRKWSLQVEQPDVYIKTHAEGSFGKKVSLVNEFQFSSKLFEILFAPVLSSEGFVRNMARIDGNGDNYNLTFTSKASKLNLSLNSIPVPITDLEYDILYTNRRLQINELKSAFESGFASVKGDIYFDDESPDVNLKYLLERAEFPVLGKSSVNVSGEGIILGNQMPYNLTGDILVNKALIVNEVDEFNSKSSSFSQIRFLPRSQETIAERLINLNLNVKAETPIRVNNSLMDVALRGEVRLFGSPTRPRGEGRLSAPINSSRVFFKNNEYAITSADLNFLARKEITNPDFDIQALTSMSNYKVYAKAYGDLERFNFDLTSEPALPRNSILSLIAFGYTDEIGSLRPEDQQSLTQMGMGSFVIEKFKISDILNKQFGVQVNVGTVFVQSEQSLLSGRSQGSSSTLQGDQGRTRSASKIELKKRLNEATILSVSSTMGGTIGSRQSMNLTYSLNRKIQLEGVYEVRSATEGEDIINVPISAGGDLKFRWSFK